MSELSNQLEIIRKATQWLREKDRSLSKSIRYSKFKTPWEIEWMKLKCRDNNLPMPFIIHGKEVLLIANNKVDVPSGSIAIDISDFMVFQFVTKEGLEKVFQVYKVFGKCILNEFPDKQLDALIKYCNSMDGFILESANKCKEKNVIGIFEKIWKEMGSENIREDDLLGKRIQYYKEILDRYKKDKNSYLQEINDLKLLG